MEELKRSTLDTHLPAAACTQKMLDDLREFAEKEDTSVSAVIRYAVGLFLQSQNDKSVINTSETSVEENNHG